MKRAFLLVGLLSLPLLAQTVSEQKQMRQILENLANARPQAELQINWDHLEIARARNLPDYSNLNENQKAAFRKAFLATLRPRLDKLKAGPGLILSKPGVEYRFQETPQGLKLTAIL